jgi:hypothetical protein
MFTHRFRDLAEPFADPAAAAAYTGVACPIAPCFFPFVQELYRLALEAAQTQARPRRRLPSFSLN